MSNYSPKKQVGNQKIHHLEGNQKDVANSNLDSAKRPTIIQIPSSQRLAQKDWSLKAKATFWSCAISMLPVLAVGSATYYIGSQQISEQISYTKPLSIKQLTATKLALQNQLSLLLMGTGVTTLLVGAIAVLLTNRALRPLLNAAALSNNIVRRLLPDQAGIRGAIASKDELVVLEKNISLIKKQLPDLLWKQEQEAERVQVLMNITRRIQECLNEEDVLKTTVEEVRTALNSDRVTIFRFHPHREGTFVAESVGFGLPKTLRTTVSVTSIGGEDIEEYQNGHIVAIDDIYQVDFSAAQLDFLERFAVKANLVAPILQKNQLFGLLIAHECTKPRFWQQSEIDLFAQIATQLGFVLNYTNLLEQVESKADQTQVFVDITRRIRESLNEEDVLKTTVEEVRKALSADRVIVYGFDSDWYGTVIAESVLPSFAKTLRAKIKDPCFAQGYIEKYQAGRVQAIGNIYEAGLTECHLRQLEPFGVKANLVAPILKDDQLFGLLIAHQCSAPRDWRKFEIDLFTQIAMQVGFALDHARLLQRIDAEAVRTHLLVDITRRIQESLNEEDVLKTTVEEVRKAISADRVIVYGFDPDWYGTVIAESVLPGFPKALWAIIRDPCFAEGYIEKYQAGRVQSVNNVYEAGLTECHLSQLEPFAVKANLVAPILKDGQLYGLLIAHECSGPRDWQQSEIDLFAQVAMQVGFALEHARLLNQVDQAYQAATATSFEQSQKHEELKLQVSELLRNGNAVVQNLSTNVALTQLQSIEFIYNQTQLLGDFTQRMVYSTQQLELQEQQLNQTVQDENQSMSQILESIYAIQQTIFQAAQRVNRLEEPWQQLSEKINLISNIISQIKLQAMHTALEASRSGDAGQKFAAIAQKALSLVQQLELEITDIQPLVADIHIESDHAIAAMQSSTEQAQSSSELIAQTQQKFQQAIALGIEMQTLVAEISQAAAVQIETSSSVNQSILEVASIANQTSEQAIALADSLAQLTLFAQEM
ncbi:methyl-accepting chemotaxis sensory transducer [Tolypothrix tenuis PCC 7101]|uniref:Methyl-accepting chemotaxis sensory transducer n=1 Tax=Tolypothrix tenuis PCC 7101 TaxID=231146 RepID=A0A1Z4N3E6_9CYAN|nr:GAF domain-containing protein [Aulosira sp. FACHB-113]BAZ00238.1 methyl-accepting chemotaxis sensory transducer [Tolypothrix tenuis PCC 7101]BAZ75841.1 methyl-accepting chemotaxis sensory transducer [Aulosira laxa NIES-50]